MPCVRKSTARHSPSIILPSVLPAGGEWGSQMLESPRTWLIAQGGQDSMGPHHTNINKFQPKQSPELAVSRDLRRKRGPLDQSRGEETGSPSAHWGRGNCSVEHFISLRVLKMSWFISTSKGSFPNPLETCFSPTQRFLKRRNGEEIVLLP